MFRSPSKRVLRTHLPAYKLVEFVRSCHVVCTEAWRPTITPCYWIVSAKQIADNHAQLGVFDARVAQRVVSDNRFTYTHACGHIFWSYFLCYAVRWRVQAIG